MKIKCKYMGEYEYFLNDKMEYDHESVDILVNVNDTEDWFPMEFMTANDDTYGFNGYMTKTNTSALGIKFYGDNYKIWMVY